MEALVKQKTFTIRWLAMGILLAGCSAGDDPRLAPSAPARQTGASRPRQLPPAPPPPLSGRSKRAVPPAGSEGAQAKNESEGSSAEAESPNASNDATEDQRPVESQLAASARSASRAKPQVQTSAIRLSTGVALPQTGPTGILMSFSVEYQFTRGEPHPSAQYQWVIKPEKGKSLKQPVQLDRRGTLEILIPGWRPEMGPFEAHLEDRGGRKLSGSLPLQ